MSHELLNKRVLYEVPETHNTIYGTVVHVGERAISIENHHRTIDHVTLRHIIQIEGGVGGGMRLVTHNDRAAWQEEMTNADS